MLPDAEAEPSEAWTKQERMTSHRACVVERRIHSSPAKRQHMFTVRYFVFSVTAVHAHANRSSGSVRSCCKAPTTTLPVVMKAVC